jgi:hypothetical protein
MGDRVEPLGSWWVEAQGLDRHQFYRRLAHEQERIQALGINPTATHMAQARKTRKQREETCE